VYLSVSSSDNKSAAWLLFMGWTDDLGARGWETNSSQNSSNSGSATFITQAVGGVPLSYQTKPSKAKGTTYNVFIVVEQLQ
jgi:hypothetical protein